MRHIQAVLLSTALPARRAHRRRLAARYDRLAQTFLTEFVLIAAVTKWI